MLMQFCMIPLACESNAVQCCASRVCFTNVSNEESFTVPHCCLLRCISGIFSMFSSEYVIDPIKPDQHRRQVSNDV